MSSDPRTSLSREELDSFAACGEQLGNIARDEILRFVREGFEISQKQDRSFVTEADVAVEKLLRAHVRGLFPEHGLLGEELEDENPSAELQWIFDPIDGTEDFSVGLPYFGCIIALHYRGLPVFAVIDHPQLDLRLQAVFGRGCTRNGALVRLEDEPEPSASSLIAITAPANFEKTEEGAEAFRAVNAAFKNFRVFRTCYAHSCAVMGSFGAMLEYNVKHWDLAASRLLTEEAGGRYLELPQHPEAPSLHRAAFGGSKTVEAIAACLPSVASR